MIDAEDGTDDWPKGVWMQVFWPKGAPRTCQTSREQYEALNIFCCDDGYTCCSKAFYESLWRIWELSGENLDATVR